MKLNFKKLILVGLFMLSPTLLFGGEVYDAVTFYGYTEEPINIAWDGDPLNSIDGITKHEVQMFHLEHNQVIAMGETTHPTQSMQLVFPRSGHYIVKVRSCHDVGDPPQYSCSDWTESLNQERSTVWNENDVTTYEDAEDGTIKGWEIYDNAPGGATIKNVYDSDRQSRVIQLSGAGSENGYRLGNDGGTEWQNSSQFIIQWSMKYSEYFQIYIDVETTAGHRYLEYRPVDYDSLGSGEYVQHGLGSAVTDGKWRRFVRDLQADLEMAQPGVEILEVNGFLVRGSGKVDDIKLRAEQVYKNRAWWVYRHISPPGGIE